MPEGFWELSMMSLALSSDEGGPTPSSATRRALERGLVAATKKESAEAHGSIVAGARRGVDRLEPEPSQLLGVALPLLRDANVQRQVDARVDQRLDSGACASADIRQPGALVADDDRLL